MCCKIDSLVKLESWKMLELTLVSEAAMSGVDDDPNAVCVGSCMTLDNGFLKGAREGYQGARKTSMA